MWLIFYVNPQKSIFRFYFSFVSKMAEVDDPDLEDGELLSSEDEASAEVRPCSIFSNTST